MVPRYELVASDAVYVGHCEADKVVLIYRIGGPVFDLVV